MKLLNYTEPNLLYHSTHNREPELRIRPTEAFLERRATKDRREYQRRAEHGASFLRGLGNAFLYLFAVLGVCWFVRWAYDMIVFWVG